MKHVYEGFAGTDVELIVEPAEADGELTAALLTAVDRLAAEAARLDPHWEITVVLGWSITDRVLLTARPAPTERTAA